MANRNANNDNWGQLLSDFGIEEQRQEVAAPPEPVMPPEAKPERQARASAVPTPSDGFGAGLVDPAPETTEEKPKEKKSIFSRFPKINFFGAPPEVSLDSVMEGVKSPSLGGKAFTDNKLEKMPVSHERSDRQKKEHRAKEHQEIEAAPAPDAWSAVASQIDVLASRETPKDSRTRPEERSKRRASSSMFDDPVPESEELRKCKDLMEEHPRRNEPRRGAFHEEESDPRHRGRGRRDSRPEEREEREVRGRGARYQSPAEVDDLPEANFELVDDEPATRDGGRGRRGSRYDGGGYRERGREQERIQDDLPSEEWSEVDAALQHANRDEPPQRGGRRQRFDGPRQESPRHDHRRRPERDEEPMRSRESDGDVSSIVAVHGDIPSWDDAVGDLIASNISRHRSHSGSGHSGRGRR